MYLEKMINKKDRILHEAVSLFASKGFFSVSTKQIANQAEVSEGLIFKHYGSKEWLLQVVFEKWYLYVESQMEKVTLLPSRKEQLGALLDFPVTMMDTDPDFRKLSYIIKLQHPELYHKMRPKDITPQINQFIENIFIQLWVPNHDLERLHLLVFFEWIVHMMIKYPEIDLKPLIEYQKNKY